MRRDVLLPEAWFAPDAPADEVEAFPEVELEPAEELPLVDHPDDDVELELLDEPPHVVHPDDDVDELAVESDHSVHPDDDVELELPEAAIKSLSKPLCPKEFAHPPPPHLPLEEELVEEELLELLLEGPEVP